MLGNIISAAGNLLGGVLGKDSARDAAGINRDMQREFAQHGVRWKVADAKAAGIHPLAALGASTHSFAPSFQGDTSLSEGLARVGQDISRSIDATRTAEERRAADAAAAAAQAVRDRNDQAVAESVINRNNAAAALDQAQAAEIGSRRAGNPPMAAVRSEPVFNHPAFGPHKRVAPDIAASRPGQPGVLAGDALPLTRIGAFTVDGSTYRLEMPNMDPGEFWENPVAAAAALRALNPHVAPMVIDKLFKREFDPGGPWGRESRGSSPVPFKRRYGRGLGGYQSPR